MLGHFNLQHATLTGSAIEPHSVFRMMIIYLCPSCILASVQVMFSPSWGVDAASRTSTHPTGASACRRRGRQSTLWSKVRRLTRLWLYICILSSVNHSSSGLQQTCVWCCVCVCVCVCVCAGSAADLCKMAMIKIFNLVSSSSSLSARYDYKAPDRSGSLHTHSFSAATEYTLHLHTQVPPGVLSEWRATDEARTSWLLLIRTDTFSENKHTWRQNIPELNVCVVKVRDRLSWSSHGGMLMEMPGFSGS